MLYVLFACLFIALSGLIYSSISLFGSVYALQILIIAFITFSVYFFFKFKSLFVKESEAVDGESKGISKQEITEIRKSFEKVD